MVEPVSLTVGALVAALVVKAAEKSGEELAEGASSVLGRLVSRLRARFSGRTDGKAVAVLERVQEVPDSPSRVVALANIVDDEAQHDSVFRSELLQIVEEANKAGLEVKSVTQTATGDQNIQVANAHGSPVSVTFSSPPHDGRH